MQLISKGIKDNWINGINPIDDLFKSLSQNTSVVKLQVLVSTSFLKASSSFNNFCGVGIACGVQLEQQ